jgi:hypothetical protein
VEFCGDLGGKLKSSVLGQPPLVSPKLLPGSFRCEDKIGKHKKSQKKV